MHPTLQRLASWIRDKVVSQGRRFHYTVTNGGMSMIVTCPWHHDQKPSLSIKIAPGDKILIYCFAGCDRKYMVEEIMSYVHGDKKNQKRYDPVAAEYQYTRADGTHVFTVCRTASKRFFIKKTEHYQKGDLRLPFQFHKLVNNPREVVCVCEGEKDALNITELGFLATTMASGANRLPSEPALGMRIQDAEQIFRGKTVCLFWDYDAAGLFHGLSWLALLYKHYDIFKARICLCPIPGAKWKWDISDYLDSVSTTDQEKRKEALLAIMRTGWSHRTKLIPEAEFWRASMFMIAETINVFPISSAVLSKILMALSSNRDPCECFTTAEGVAAIRSVMGEYNKWLQRTNLASGVDLSETERPPF